MVKYFLTQIVIVGTISMYAQSSEIEIVDDAIKLTPNERQLNMQFGWSVDVLDKFLFVGSPLYSSKIHREQGCTFIFKLDADSFVETHKLTPSLLDDNINYGKCVKMNKNYFFTSTNEQKLIKSVAKYSHHKKINDYVLFGSIEVSSPLNLLEGVPMNRSVIMHKDTKKDLKYANSIDVSDEFLITSLPFYSNENFTTGKVVVYEQVKEAQFKLFMEISPPENTTYFGQSVAIVGNDIIVGANNEAFIYTISKTDSIIKLVANFNRKNSMNFGDNVAIVSNYAFVTNKNNIPPYFGSKIPDTDSIFSMVMINENREISSILIPNDAVEKKKNGVSDELFRREAIPVYDSIAAYKQLEFSEEVIVYKKNNDNVWKYHQTLYSNRRTPFEFFGSSIDAKDSICVVGAFSSPISYEFNNSNAYAGAAFIFELQKDGFWKLTKKLIPKKREYWTKFGFAVATDGKSVVVGSRFDNTDKDYDNYIDDTGAVYYYSIRK